MTPHEIFNVHKIAINISNSLSSVDPASWIYRDKTMIVLSRKCLLITLSVCILLFMNHPVV